MAAMLKVVGERGFHDTTIASVIDVAGVSWPTFFFHFGDRSACYLAASAAAEAEARATVLGVCGGEHDWISKLRAGLATILDYLDRDHVVARALIVEARAAGTMATARLDRLLKTSAAFIDTAWLEPESLAPPTHVTAMGVAGGIFSVLHHRLAIRADGALRDLLPELIHVAVRPYFGVQAATKAEAEISRH
ncbi:MAG TPA: TetR family transcriptional regulator [Solirubrobacterales bacterium]|nr:TetR family transcriptional regulator [Solirubrobacterales bacterium]